MFAKTTHRYLTSLACVAASALAAAHSNGQTSRNIDFNKQYKGIVIRAKSVLSYNLSLDKGGIYQFSILQQGIAVYYTLIGPNDQMLYESDYPDDTSGYEKFEYSPQTSGTYKLTIRRFNDPENPDSGLISFVVKSLTKREIETRLRIKKELEPENNKNVTTIDIDHFWDAFDNLPNCKTFADSAECFQKFYLDRATNGLLDFIQVRDLTSEKFVDAVSKNASFYRTVRNNTLEAKQAEPGIDDVFRRFRVIYPDFKPFKVCFAIGIKNTGGTVSNQFVLIGTEVTTSFDRMDTTSTETILKRINGIVAHECVHTQQKPHSDSSAVQCPLLYQSLKEGACDFIAELITGTTNRNEYGEQNENRLWIEFKNELCNQNIGNWLYNGYSVKDKPADLGYFIGYEITKEYYNNSADKDRAVGEIIGMSDPVRFLELSKYDQKVKR